VEGAPLVTTLERARAGVESWDEELRRELPEGAYLFDVHTHLGDDIDGMVGDHDELASTLDHYGFGGAFMFCLDEHDREPAFSVPNDRTLAHAERSAGRLIPFVRLDLTAQPLEEARRCLDRGARGIKLHPRAQAFALSDERLQPVFALAVERSVPILIHGGRGLPPIAEDLEALVRRNDGVQLIVAHAGIADMAGLAGRLGGIQGVFFDTSVWSGLDLLDLYRQIAPEQVIYASDYPYGRQPNSLLVATRTAKLAGFDDKQLRLMLGGSARRMIAGEELEPLSAPKGPTSLVQPLTFARIHQYISMAVPMLWLRQRDAIGALGLAVNASRERANGHPDESERIEELLATAQELWRAGVEIEDSAERITTFRAAIQLVNLADMVSLTTRA
jgi:predicted TIM-barrel fold metal-dependent hydrolase